MTSPYPVPPQYDTRPLLDIAVDRMRRYDDRPWGATPAVLPLVALAGLIVAGSVIGHSVHPGGYAARVAVSIGLNVGLYLVLALAVRAAGQEVAQRYGGWGNAFGLRRPMVVGLTTAPDRLIQVRRNRLLSLNQAPETAYVDVEKVTREVQYARRMFADNGWPVIDVTRRSIEETAAAVINLLNERQAAGDTAQGPKPI